MRILGGDIGGTKTLLRLVENEQNLYEARFESSKWLGFQPLLEEFFRVAPPGLTPESACFAVAGPVKDGRSVLTNLPWKDLDSAKLSKNFRIHMVSLINDFHAVGVGISVLPQEDFACLQVGRRQPRAPQVVLGAGTGLGQGILVWQENSYQLLETEGGHVDFAPVDEEQIQLLRFLKMQYDRVSVERILSGSGLEKIYQCFCGSALSAAGVSAGALSGEDSCAVRALRLFTRIYGQQAGNLALTCLARGGVYLAGGIAPRILPFLQENNFLEAFCAKGRMSQLMLDMPVYVVLNPKVGIVGAVQMARVGSDSKTS
ncbi:Glucokinase [Gammaproteobacteria bacterium]